MEILRAKNAAALRMTEPGGGVYGKYKYKPPVTDSPAESCQIDKRTQPCNRAYDNRCQTQPCKR